MGRCPRITCMKITIDYVLDGELKYKVLDLCSQGMNHESVGMAKHMIVDLLERIMNGEV